MSSRATDTTYKGYRFRNNVMPAEPKNKMQQRSDYTGHTFGRLKVVECLGMAPFGYRWWGCQCDCGKKVAVRSRELRRGHTRSCGCLQLESLAAGGHNKLPFGEASFNELFASYIKSASGRKHDWFLTKDEFRSKVTSNCVYCGVHPSLERKPNKGVNGGFFYTGIDRVENTTGYTEENTVSCCWDCNRAKGVMTVADFQKWIERLTRHTRRMASPVH